MAAGTARAARKVVNKSKPEDIAATTKTVKAKAGKKAKAAEPPVETVTANEMTDDEMQPEASTSKDAVDAKGRAKKAPAKVAPAKAPSRGRASMASATKAQTTKEEVPASRGVKRARPVKEDKNAVKKARLDEDRMALRGPLLAKVAAEGGVVLTVGQGDTGQLGCGEDVMEASKPKEVTSLNGRPVISVCAGGMHSLCLTIDGEVYSFGCNDDGALGRKTDDDSEIYTPGKVALEGKIVQICAGDSHSVALTDDGKVYYWGNFRDNSGGFGLTSDGKSHPEPIPLAHHLEVKKIVSGENHIVMLTADGQLYTLGCAEQGRLGRVGEPFVGRNTRRGLALLLNPDVVRAKNRRVVFADVWAGSMSTVALTVDKEVLVCGLNNYSQLGIDKKTEIFTMTASPAFTKISQENGLAQVTFGQHHVLLLDGAGKVYAIGRHDYGVLGLGEEVKSEVHVPTHVQGELADKQCYEIGCGSSVSYAVTIDGQAFSWGMGTNGQLAHSEEEDALEPTAMMGKQLKEKSVVGVSSGGQHTILLAKAQ